MQVGCEGTDVSGASQPRTFESGLRPGGGLFTAPWRDKTNTSKSDQEQEWIKNVSQTLERVRALVARGEVHVSLHGYEELAADKVLVHDIISSLDKAIVAKIILTIRKDRASWFWSRTKLVNRSM